MTGFDIKYFITVLPVILKALPITITISVFSMAFGLIIGTIITFLRRTPIQSINRIFDLYVSFFRGTPLMVQLFIFFFGLPQVMPLFSKVNAFNAAIIVLSVNASAYISEVLRATIDAVDRGQLEAALSLGMTKYQAMERIVLPQAFKIALLPLGNTFISLIQGTAIIFMIGLKDIMGISKISAASSYRFLEAYLAVGVVYWLLTLLVTKLINSLSYKLSKGGIL